MRKSNDSPELRVVERLDLYKAFPVPRRRDRLTHCDLQNAIALIKHLARCHRAALEVPGVAAALTKHPYVFNGEIEQAGIHCDHAYVFVADLLHAAQGWCAEQIEESSRRKST